MEKNVEISEHILVCISPSPSNMKVIAEAVKMADAFHATLTAIYVKPTNYDALSAEDKARLRVTIRRLALMNSDNSADRSVYTNGKLEINYSAGCAFLNGEELKLTPMEYKLLCLLAKKYREGADSHIYNSEYLGPELGQRHSFAARVHGHATQEAGVRAGFPSIYTDPHRHRLSNAEGRLTGKG